MTKKGHIKYDIKDLIRDDLKVNEKEKANKKTI